VFLFFCSFPSPSDQTLSSSPLFLSFNSFLSVSYVSFLFSLSVFLLFYLVSVFYSFLPSLVWLFFFVFSPLFLLYSPLFFSFPLHVVFFVLTSLLSLLSRLFVLLFIGQRRPSASNSWLGNSLQRNDNRETCLPLIPAPLSLLLTPPPSSAICFYKDYK